MCRLPAGSTIALLQGRPDNPSLNDRVKGMKSKLGIDVTIVAEPTTDCDENNGFAAMQAVLAAHPKFSAVYAACGPPANHFR